ncbi:MAG: hypothetical protein IJ571_03710 [Ruminococcus sp.]|nr:hypothetical protein [Ruminococcus sp.]
MITKILIGEKLCRTLGLKQVLEDEGHIVCLSDEEPFAMLERYSECRPNILVISALMKDRHTFLMHINKSFGHTYTIVLSPAHAVNGIDIAGEGVDRILTEPYTAEDICKLIHSDSKNGRVERSYSDSDNESIAGVLKKLGVAPNYTGYKYLIDTVDLIIAKGGDTVSLTKLIYPAIGQKYNVTANSVERSIRTAIKNTWHNSPESEIMKYFGVYALTPGFKPSNSRYVYALADYLRNHCRSSSESIKI